MSANRRKALAEMVDAGVKAGVYDMMDPDQVYRTLLDERAEELKTWIAATNREAESARHWRGRWYVAQESGDRWRAAFWFAVLVACVAAGIAAWAMWALLAVAQ